MFRRKETVFVISTSALLLLAYPAFGAASFSIGDKLVVDIVNDLILFILSIAGRIVLLMLVFGGIYYIISGSNPDGQVKAKKIIVFAILGVILTLMSYALVELIDKIFVQP